MDAFLNEKLQNLKLIHNSLVVQAKENAPQLRALPIGIDAPYDELIAALNIGIMAIRTVALQAELFGFQVNEWTPEDIVKAMCDLELPGGTGPGPKEEQLELALGGTDETSMPAV